MTTTVSSNESKVFTNRIGFSGSFYKFLGEDIKIGNQILYPGCYEFDYLIKLNDECKNGYLTFSFTGSIKIKKGNGRYYDFISGAIGDIITYFKPELSIFEKLHTCNHLGQPMFIDDIRYHINEGKSNQEISEMYNISDMKAIEILRNASDDKNLFYYLVFRLGVAENWEKLAGEAIQEIEKRSEFSGNYFHIFDTALKCIDDWNGNLYFDGIKLSFGTKVVDICFCMSAQDINKYFDKYSIVTIKPDKLTKIKRGKPIAQYTDDMLKLVSLDSSSMTYVVNGDIGTAKNIQSIVLYDEIGKIVVSCDDGEKIECQFDGESILQSVLKEM